MHQTTRLPAGNRPGEFTERTGVVVEQLDRATPRTAPSTGDDGSRRVAAARLVTRQGPAGDPLARAAARPCEYQRTSRAAEQITSCSRTRGVGSQRCGCSSRRDDHRMENTLRARHGIEARTPMRIALVTRPGPRSFRDIERGASAMNAAQVSRKCVGGSAQFCRSRTRGAAHEARVSVSLRSRCRRGVR